MELPDIPRLYTAIAEWASCMLFIINQPKRCRGWITAAICTGALAVLIAFHCVAGILPLYLWVAGMITAVLLMFSFIFGSCKINLRTACYWVAQAFIIAEFIAAMEWWLNYFFVTTFPVLSAHWFEILLVALIYPLAFTGIFFLDRRYRRSIGVGVGTKDVISVLGIAIAVFFTSNISFVPWDTPFSSHYPLEIFYTRTLVDFCGMLFIYASREQRLSNHAKEELFHMQNLLDKQYAQYCVTNETIDAINRKYHDLKHYLTVLKSEYGSTEEGRKLLGEIEEEVQSFDIIYQTGNKVLDTILTSKASVCAEKGIEFSCIADGSAISNLSDMDICSIFGNAIDNAIEGADRVEDRAKRLIELTVVRRNDIVVIKCENYFEHEIIRRLGAFITTKKDKRNHGYGIKSIKYVVERYGGHVTIVAKDGWFTLCVVIPAGATASK